MKRILFIHHATGWGGAPISLLKLIKAIDLDQYQVKVLLIKDSIVSERFKEAGIECVVAHSGFYNRYYHYLTHSEADYIKWFQVYKFIKLSVYWLLSRYIYASRELKLHDYDLVHLNSSVLTDWLAPASKFGKVLIHIREPFRRGKLDILGPVFRRQVRKYADHVIAISKDNMMRLGLQEKTSVVYNFTEVELLNEQPIEKYEAKTALYVGGLSRIKGFYTLVEAMPFLNPEIKVIFAGYYPQNNERHGLVSTLKNKVKDILFYKSARLRQSFNEIENGVNVGLHSDINKLIDEATCLLSPFTVPHFSRPIVESFARRKPVIATDIPGMNELVEHDKSGLLIPNHNPEALAKAINTLCFEKDKSKRMGDNGYNEALNKYSQKNITEVVLLYDQLLQDLD